MNRYACYCMTRNIYHKVWPSLNSLMQHTEVDKVFLLTEDDDIGYEIPRNVQIVNVKDQGYFRKDGPNYGTKWTYMVLMRTALSKVFPKYDRILSLDLDTIIEENIGELWDMPIENHYLAGVPEPQNTRDGFVYVNCGVILWNLAKLRDGKADEIIESLNTKRWPFCEQDCVNHLCQGGIYHLSSIYNSNPYTVPTSHPKIYHFAAQKDWYEYEPRVQKYKEKVEG